MNFKKFKSIDGSVRRISTLSGHVFLVDGDWTEIPEFAWSPAYAEGCISEDMLVSAKLSDIPEFRRERLIEVSVFKEAIEKVILELIAENDLTAFRKTDGLPSAKRISERVGKPVSNNQVLEVWDRLLYAQNEAVNEFVKARQVSED